MKQRVRLTFRKEGAIRFISHHDVMRTFERLLRRTGLPLRASEGFNPRPRISFPAALGVGIASEGEVCEFDLDTWVAPGEIRARVGAQMPAGLGLADLEVISPREKGTVARAVYRVAMEGAPLPTPEQVAALLEAGTAVIVRRRGNREKDIDVRPFLRALRHEGDRLVMTIRTTPAGAVRPEEVLRAMGVPDDTIKRHARIVREKVILQ